MKNKIACKFKKQNKHKENLYTLTITCDNIPPRYMWRISQGLYLEIEQLKKYRDGLKKLVKTTGNKHFGNDLANTKDEIRFLTHLKTLFNQMRVDFTPDHAKSK